MENLSISPSTSRSSSRSVDVPITQQDDIQTIVSVVNGFDKEKATIQTVSVESSSSPSTSYLVDQKNRGRWVETSLYVILIVGASLFLGMCTQDSHFLSNSI